MTAAETRPKTNMRAGQKATLRFVPALARFSLGGMAVLFALVSWKFMSDPINNGAAHHILVSSGAGKTNLRVGFGALPLASALTFMFCAMAEHRRVFGLALAATMMGVVVGARTIGVLIDGEAASSAPELVVGTAIFVVLLFTLVLESGRRQQFLNQRA